MQVVRRHLPFGTGMGAYSGNGGLAHRPLSRQVHAVLALGTQGSALGDSLVQQATVLNDAGTPTFARASTAFDPYNKVTAISGARRRRQIPISRYLNANADLIEGARTNLLLQSQTLSNASWTGVALTSVTAASTTAPDGTLTGNLMVEDGTTANHQVRQDVTKAGSTIGIALSCYVKAKERTAIVISMSDTSAANSTRVVFSAIDTAAAVMSVFTQAGTLIIGTTALIENAGNGWWRISIAATIDSTITTVRCIVRMGGGSYAGDGVSGIYVWGVQCEAMPTNSTTAVASSYIATTTGTVARVADALSVAYVLGQVGTILALCIPYGWSGDQDGTTGYIVWNADDTNTSGVVRAGATTVIATRPDAGGAQTTSPTVAFASRGLQQIGLTWSAPAVSAYVSGAASGTPDTTLSAPYNTNTIIRIGAGAAGATPFFGHVALLAWARTLNASEISALYASLPSVAA